MSGELSRYGVSIFSYVSKETGSTIYQLIFISCMMLARLLNFSKLQCFII